LRGAPRARRLAAAAIALRARGEMAFGVPFCRPPYLAWPLAKLAWWRGRARPGQVPRLNGLAAISDPIMLCSSGTDLVAQGHRQVSLFAATSSNWVRFCELWVAPLAGRLCPFYFRRVRSRTPGPLPFSSINPTRRGSVPNMRGSTRLRCLIAHCSPTIFLALCREHGCLRARQGIALRAAGNFLPRLIAQIRLPGRGLAATWGSREDRNSRAPR